MTEITCPVCGWEHPDSWAWRNFGELEETEGTLTCYGCDKELTVKRVITVTYTVTVNEVR